MEDFKMPFHAEKQCYNSTSQFHVSVFSLIFPQDSPCLEVVTVSNLWSDLQHIFFCNRDTAQFQGIHTEIKVLQSQFAFRDKKTFSCPHPINQLLS